MAYGGSQARGSMGAVAASLHRSHRNVGFKAMSVTYTTAHSNPLSEARDQIHDLMDASLVR